MNSLDTLFFPATDISSSCQYPLFLLFRPVHILLPVEPDNAPEVAADIFTTSSFCQAHTPCPLGENRQRFLHLIRDIEQRKDDYAAQLSALTIASMSAPKQSMDDSQQAIVTSLLGGHGVISTTKEEEDQATKLWQARLVLKIAEILDHEEEEVGVQLALLEDQESELFKRLQGEMDEEEETLFDEVQQLKQKMSRPTAGAINNRFNAWKQLYLSGPSPEKMIWTTHLPEVADRLLDLYHDRTGKPAATRLELFLPAHLGWNTEEAIRQIESYRQANATLIDQIGALLAGQNGDSEKSALAEKWQEAVDHAFPIHHHGRTTLTFYALQDHPCAALLGQPAAQTNAAGTLLGVVRDNS